MKSNIRKTPLIITAFLLLSPSIIFAQVEQEQTQSKSIVTDNIQYLNIPERPTNAPSGSAFAKQVWNLGIEEREKAVVKEFLFGNVPSFSRTLKAITFYQTIDDCSYVVSIYALCDYLAIGSDEDYFYIPLTPAIAQHLADKLDCILPTQKLVDVIYDQADIKLKPQPIAPSDAMATVPVFWQHTDSIQQQFMQLGLERHADKIVGGTK